MSQLHVTGEVCSQRHSMWKAIGSATHVEAVEVVQLVKCLPCKEEADISLSPREPKDKTPGVEA